MLHNRLAALSAGGRTPSLTLNLLAASTGDSRLTTVRAAGGATYFDINGTIQTAAANTQRLDYDPVTHALRGLLVEESRTNLLLNTATLSTQSVTVAAVPNTLSFYGTGTVTLSGTFSGTLNGGGAFPTRVSLTFTPTAGTLTATVSGSVLNAQIEAGSSMTSYIPCVGSPVTRAADVVSLATGSWFNANAGTLIGNALLSVAPVGSQNIVDLDNGTTSNRISLGTIAAGPNASANIVAGGSGTLGKNFTSAFVTTVAVGASYATGVLPIAVASGNAVFTGSATTLPVFTTLYLGCLTGTTQFLNGYVTQIRYFPRAMSSAELALTTV